MHRLGVGRGDAADVLRAVYEPWIRARLGPLIDLLRMLKIALMK